MSIGDRIRAKRKERNLTQTELGKRINVSSQVISNWERGYTSPSHEDVAKLSEALSVSTEYLHGRESEDKTDDLPKLTNRDERDIQKDLQRIIDSLESGDGYSQFDGQTVDDMDEEDRELLIASLENSMRLAKRIAKQKFTPKKYRK